MYAKYTVRAMPSPPPGGDNKPMPGRTSELLAFLTKAGPRSAPSGWALALDAAIAVGATAGAAPLSYCFVTFSRRTSASMAGP
jgi:hypothetical protein